MADLTPAALRLRATLAMLTEQRDEARAEARSYRIFTQEFRAQTEELLTLGVSIHKATAAGIDLERAAVIRWLCRAAEAADVEARRGLAGAAAAADVYALAAIAIERGDHRGDE